MLNLRSFSEILEELLPPKQHTREQNIEQESDLEPLGFSHILHILSETHTSFTTKNTTQARIKKAYPSRQQVKKMTKRPSHLLNEAQRSALMLLKSYCPHIADNFNLHELKSAYRHSVLKTHPDQGGNSETFQQVKKSYQILFALVKN
ncbi:MAG: DnaJ domain-containing protein [Bdellovibrionota bacterium]